MSAARGFVVLAPPTLATVLLCALLASCSEGALFSGIGSKISGESVPATAEIRDASVFQKTENALWDGRPSLGGVWIAHADATTPERVEIRNEETGQVIQAALFRRERDFPGPSFQLSSDAAVALGVTAGMPTSVTVTALRREPVAPPPAPEPAVTEDPTVVIAEDPALIAADAAIEESLAPENIALSESADEPAAAGSAGSSLFGAKPQNTGFNAPIEDLAPIEAENSSPAAEDQAAPDTLESSAPSDALATEPAAAEPKGGSAGSALGNRPTLVNDAGEPIPLNGSSLEPITATEILAVPLPQETAVPAEIALETSLESAVLPEPEPVTASDLERPFVQVASGSSRDNADTLVKKLVAVGLSASVRETTKDGKALFYVVVGPASTQAELDANLAKIRELGFPEAFIAKG